MHYSLSTTEDEDPDIKKETEAMDTENKVVDEEEFKKEMTKPILELNELSAHLKIVFLETNNFLVIVST